MNLALLCFIIQTWLLICSIYSRAEEGFSFVSKECNLKLRGIDSIKKFETFMQNYKALLHSSHDSPERGNSRYRKCLNLEEPLLELEKLVESRSGVCQVSYVNRLVDFHFKYLTKSRPKQNQDSQVERDLSRVSTGKSYLNYFFSLYAHEVVKTCKSKINQRIKEAQLQHSCSPVLHKFLPMIFSSASPNLDELQDVNEVKEFLHNFKRIEDYSPLADSPVKTKGYLDVMLPNSVADKIQEMKNECFIREPYYKALFNPVATLAQLNYIVEDDERGDPETDQKLLACWLAVTQLCQGIMRTHLTVNNDVQVDPELETKFMTIKWGDLPNDLNKNPSSETILYEDKVEEITVDTVRLVDKKFNTNILQKIKTKALSSVKNFIMRHIDIETMQRDAIKKFLDSITETGNGLDSEVAFAGKKFDNKRFNPTSIVVNDIDTAIKGSSVLWNKEFAMIASSIVAVVMSAVFVWFSLYALALSTSNHVFGVKDNDNFKSQWRDMRDKRVQAIESKFAKSVRGIHTYKP